jgi:hypothetical protein
MNATSNIALKVPFNEKDQAKSLGARWNSEAKHWYIPQGVDAAPFEKWLTSAPALANTPIQASATLKPTTSINRNSDFNANTINEDIEAINAALRDAYEPREIEPF